MSARGTPVRSPRRRRVFLCAAAIGALLAIAGLLGYRWLTQPERLRRFTEAYLQRFFATEVTVGSAEFSLFGGLRLTGVAVADGDGSDRGAPLLSCAEVFLRNRLAHLLLGRMAIDEVVATQPVCRLVFERSYGQFNLQRILRFHEGAASGEIELPALRLRDVHVTLAERGGAGPRLVEELYLDIEGARSTKTDGEYELTWHARTQRASAGRARLDLAHGVVRDLGGGAPWLSIEAAALALEATQPAARRWIELLGMSGRFHAIDYAFPLRPREGAAAQVVVEFENARLSVPLDDVECDLPAGQRYLRLDDVSGRVTVAGDEAVAEVAGSLHGSACRGRVRLFGGEGVPAAVLDLGMEVEAELTDWLLPRADAEAPADEVRFINRWGRLQRLYRNFDPHGRVDVRLSLAKAPGAGSPVVLRGATVDGRGADAAHRAFPYRVSDLTGRVTFDERGIHLLGLTGRHDDAVIVAQGWVARQDHAAAADLYFTGANVPLDDALCAAITGRYRRAWESFHPAGFADITMHMSRPDGPTGDAAPWAVAVEAELHEASAMFDGFPYRVDDLAGRVTIAGDTIRVERLHGAAAGGAVDVHGLAEMAATTMAALDLHIEARDVPLDHRLCAALAPAARRRLESFDPTGRLDLHARLGWDPLAARIDYDIAVVLDAGRVQPVDWPVGVENVQGDLHLRPDGLDLSNLRGRLGAATVEAEGQIADPLGDARFDVRLRGRGLRLDDHLRRALPAPARDALADWRIDGPLDADVELGATSAGPRPVRLLARVRPAGVAVAHALCPLPLRVTGGEVRVEDGRIRLDGLRASVDEATLEASGEIDFRSGGTRVDLSFAASNVAFTEALRSAVPWRLRRLWNDVQPRGTFEVRGGRITFTRAAGSATPRWTLDGLLVLRDAAFDVGTPLRDLTGTVRLTGAAEGALESLALDAAVEVDHVRIGGWQLENVRANLEREQGGRRWRFPDVTGALYGGNIGGELEIVTGEPGTRYDLTARVRGMALQGLADAMGSAAATTPPRPPVKGVVEGRLYLSGAAGDNDSRRGGGRFSIRDAELFRLPLLLEILRVVNLAPPDAGAFQQADADFFITGRDLQLRNVLLRGPALAMIGQGSMTLPTRELDARLVMVSPHRWAQTPVLTELLEGTARELVEIEVTGTPRQPTITARPLRALDEAMEKLLVPRHDGSRN